MTELFKRCYRLQRRNEWLMVGTDKVLLPFLRGVLVMSAAMIAYAIVSHNADAATVRENQTAAIQLSKQAAYINELETVLAKCLTRGDNAILVGGEIGLCGLTMTGVKAK